MKMTKFVFYVKCYKKKCVFLQLLILFRIIALIMPGRDLRGYAHSDGFNSDESDDDSVIVEEVSFGLKLEIYKILSSEFIM